MSPVEPDPNAGLNGAVAGELRAVKARRQSSNERISERSGIPIVSVNRYMAGKRAINVAVLEQLAAALETDAASIIAAAVKELHQRPVDELARRRAAVSEDAPTVDLTAEPSAAEPERRDDEDGDDHA